MARFALTAARTGASMETWRAVGLGKLVQLVCSAQNDVMCQGLDEQ
jgi:hypothetical protein